MDQREAARLQTRNGEAVHLLGVTLTGELRGLLLEAQVEQRFHNPGDTHVEIVYSFPLPWGAVLLGVQVLLGGQRLTGAVVEKKQAQARYEDALGDGHAALLLEENHDRSYSLNLGNLAAGEHCSITLRYAQTLQFAQRGLRLLIPTVIAPRYGDALQEGGLQPHQVPRHSLAAEHPFDLTLRLHGALAQARVASPSHPVAVAHGQTEQGSVLTLSLARSAVLDRDFVLVIDQLTHDAFAVAAPDNTQSCSHPHQVAMLASFCPRLAAHEAAVTAVKILVDCSGSMAGDSIQAARQALQAIVQQFQAGERFSLSRFGDTVQHRGRSLWKLTEATRLAAQRWVSALEADLGGTGMEAALASTFALTQGGGGAGGAGSDVLLVTDGEISAIDPTLATARQSGHRLFIVGIGSSPAEAHLRRLADASGGACDFVAPGEDVAPAVLRMFARLRSPRLTDLRLQWPEGATPTWVSPLPLSVFDGDTVNVFALLPQQAAGAVRLLGGCADGAAEQDIAHVALPSTLDSSDALPRLAAAARTPCADGAQALALALDYQLVTARTHFLLVHERPEGQQATDMPALHRVAQMLPAGWGGTGAASFSRSAAPGLAVPSRSMAVPTVWRTSRSSAAARASVLASGSPDDLDIPAFLRKSAPAAALDRSNPRLWARTDHYSGLTPLGVAEWLRRTPQPGWPSTYDGLRAMGLGVWVVDWLQWRVARHGGAAHAEAATVAAFLHLMAWPQTRTAPAPGQSLHSLLHATVRRLRSALARNATAAQPPIAMDLVEAMAADLAGMAGEEWPDAVLSFDAGMQEGNHGPQASAVF